MEEIEADEESFIKQHRKEKKDLQAKIQSMKNAVPKNDKKRRKQLVEEIAKLEAELDQKHEEELKQLKNKVDEETIKPLENGIECLSMESGEQQNLKSCRISKAQKRRDKKAAIEKERENRIAEAEIENLSGARHLEYQKLSQGLAQRHLQIKQIPSDGHCMYRAIEDQLICKGLNWNVQELRAQTAKYMRDHSEDFLPFLTNPCTGDVYTSDEFEKYCTEIGSTAAWGGQLELRALSHILKTPMEVIQAEAPSIVIGEEYENQPVILIYMRHAYGLGEHYNSVEPLKETLPEEES
ncbi:deubiquitinase OTUD6B [Polypterus senegalus]|uniref:deubiquitinase OTUD6B n=1 Tax=Polypterus senegalus TaxID=55291 RepID=UPI0019640847|nr:deubiquitinase OTUD6B [Polypterus senegalus]